MSWTMVYVRAMFMAFQALRQTCRIAGSDVQEPHTSRYGPSRTSYLLSFPLQIALMCLIQVAFVDEYHTLSFDFLLWCQVGEA